MEARTSCSLGTPPHLHTSTQQVWEPNGPAAALAGQGRHLAVPQVLHVLVLVVQEADLPGNAGISTQRGFAGQVKFRAS